MGCQSSGGHVSHVFQAAAFNQDLCSLELKVPTSVAVLDEFFSSVFKHSIFPFHGSPNSANFSAGPWCHACSHNQSSPPGLLQINLVLDGLPFLVSKGEIASGTTFTCETQAGNGDNLFMTTPCGNCCGCEESYNHGSNETVSFTLEEITDVVACCTGKEVTIS
jgi:hypothetical protein